MNNLVSTPDFKGLPSLQKLTLEFCHELEEIHPSLGNHKSLEYVRISWCENLRKFPTIVHMEKLQTLEIKDCHKIFEFPEIQANMEKLLLSDFDEMRFHQFLPSSLQKLDLSWCSLEDGTIFLSGIAELSNLEELNLSGNKFTRLDSGLFSQLTRLKILKLRSCIWLVELPELPSSVAILNADYCHSLTAVGDSLTNCRCLRQVTLSGGGIINDGDRVLESMLQGNANRHLCKG